MIRRRPVLAIAGKELRSWFCSPLFFGTGLFFLLFISVWLYYFQAFFAMDSADLRPFFSGFLYVYILAVPAVTMKSWTDEKKSGTAELLFTMPISDWELCLGKFISTFAVVLVYVGLTVPVPLSLLPLAKPDPGIIVNYAGVVFLGAYAVSLGLFFSCMFKNQSAAFLSCAIMLLVQIYVDFFTGSFVSSPAILRFLQFISLSSRYESFLRELLDSRDLVFFITCTILFLFLSTRLLIKMKRS